MTCKLYMPFVASQMADSWCPGALSPTPATVGPSSEIKIEAKGSTPSGVKDAARPIVGAKIDMPMAHR
jgi:hypothetical protein